ncbi:GNAT family N-acetyltransferase [Pseudoalteromonas fenneropenaei]|uniref:GNAT family N-acetyltransferase n=1 Tax=Pseudoalteromonas fenneropenaei TaxID=1737459 RepID=A0ABV7CGP7_9GAMM
MSLHFVVVKQLEPVLIGKLTTLLAECVDSGASLGFYQPAEPTSLTEYWQGLCHDILTEKRTLLVVYNDSQLAATVQLHYCHKQNGLHRAEVEKLLVAPRYQRQGIATQLMAKMELLARFKGIKLLFLDTQTGDKSELFYQALGYQLSGTIPAFVSCHLGQLHSTSVYYKQLSQCLPSADATLRQTA